MFVSIKYFATCSQKGYDNFCMHIYCYKQFQPESTHNSFSHMLILGNCIHLTLLSFRLSFPISTQTHSDFYLISNPLPSLSFPHAPHYSYNSCNYTLDHNTHHSQSNHNTISNTSILHIDKPPFFVHPFPLMFDQTHPTMNFPFEYPENAFQFFALHISMYFDTKATLYDSFSYSFALFSFPNSISAYSYASSQFIKKKQYSPHYPLTHCKEPCKKLPNSIFIIFRSPIFSRSFFPGVDVVDVTIFVDSLHIKSLLKSNF